MKIQCNVCEKAEATVFCFADDAALCKRCDEKVHAANKLATKHQRVALSTSANNHLLPKCDICQEADGYFFCLEDRALLCRKCDVAIHTLNTLVSSHQRFLLTGVKIGPQTPAASDTLPSDNNYATTNIEVPDTVSPPTNSSTMSIQAAAAAGIGDFVSPKLPHGGGSSAPSIQHWQFDEFFGLADLNQNYDYIEDYSSKTDSNKVGDSDCSSILRALEVELDADDYLGQVPASSWAVPEVPSPPTASGLNWSKGHHYHNYHQMVDTAAFVPDVCYSPMSSYNQSQQTLKRRRHF
uniref:B-box zinc finger protein 22-like n=1 Tax=Erigeron canadensis TaxID=72917 RepID=UPI001CB8A6F8|nr:B-box zinc finger protein 22-like [Erigeron canadensis]